jgi:hypothetical protein
MRDTANSFPLLHRVILCLENRPTSTSAAIFIIEAEKQSTALKEVAQQTIENLI